MRSEGQSTAENNLAKSGKSVILSLFHYVMLAERKQVAVLLLFCAPKLFDQVTTVQLYTFPFLCFAF